jgi:hypothetical protein
MEAQPAQEAYAMLVDKDRTPTDTTRVDLEEDWEVRWWCDRFGCTEIELRNAVRKVGPSTDDIELELKKAAKQVFKNTGED